MRRVLSTVGGVLLVATVTACGTEGTTSGATSPSPGETTPSSTQPSASDPSESDSSESDPSESESSEAPSNADTALEITLREVEGQGEEELAFMLWCDPVGGDLPSATTACENLATAPVDPFEPVPPDRLCLDVIEGPGQITVTGRWDGERVDAQFSLRNSCETARFYEITRILALA